MKLKFFSFFLVIFILISCSNQTGDEKKTFDSRGRATSNCAIRAGDGRGPYELLGRFTEVRCEKEIAKLCSKDKYKQVHRYKGHFARGKFGERIMIGTCP